MLPRLLVAAVLVLGAVCARAQVVDPNLQNLLAALTTGSETTLITPLATGMVQVTSFRPAGRMSGADAAAAMDRARNDLRALGEENPTGEQIARMLAGGPIDVPTGRIHARGILPASGQPASIRSSIVAAGTPVPQVGAPSAAAGGTAPVAPPAWREAAVRELAAIGILNPSEDQIRTAIVGGTISTVNGVYQLPGLLPRQ